MSIAAAICADKGSPGATTLGLLLAAASARPTILVEADPSGGDLRERLFAARNYLHEPAATLLALAAAARHGADPSTLAAHAARTPVGVRLIDGIDNADQQSGLLALWPSLIAALSASDTDVLVDLGRINATHPGLGAAVAARHVLVATRTTLEELVRLRSRILQLRGLRAAEQTRISVVVVSPDKTAHADERSIRRVLDAAGLDDVAVVWFPFAPADLSAFLVGRLSPRSQLWRASIALTADLSPDPLPPPSSICEPTDVAIAGHGITGMAGH